MVDDALVEPATDSDLLNAGRHSAGGAPDLLVPQGGCAHCRGRDGIDQVVPAPSFIYALGQIEARFPRLSVEKEFAQVVGRIDTRAMTDRQTLHAALSMREHRYLARQLCWVLTVQGIDTYILVPRDTADLDLLIEVLAPQPQSLLNAVIGVRGPIAPADLCNGLMVPVVGFDQIYTFDRDSLLAAIPRPETIPTADFTPAAAELFDRVLQLADNVGGTDEHRAINYVTLRYPVIYAKVAEEYANECSLDGVETKLSRLSGTRKIVDVIFAFTDRRIGFTKKYFVRVDVSEEFPFLTTKLTAYYDR